MNSSTGLRFSKTLLSATQGGLIAAGINIAWLFAIEYFLKVANLPKGFQVAVVLATLLPILLGAVVYYFLSKQFKEAKRMFLFIGASFVALSLFPSFETTLADGNPVPDHWVLITVPMHFIAGAIGLFYITKEK